MNGNLNQPITLPSFGQIVYHNSGVPGVFNTADSYITNPCTTYPNCTINPNQNL